MACAIGGLAAESPSFAAPADLYAMRCAMCHQPNAAGLAGQFPRLAGRVGMIAQTPDGRHYLALVLLNGMYGPIKVDGSPLSGMMPTMRGLKDEDIAGILNHLVQLKPAAKKQASFTPAEIARVRTEATMSGAKVAAERARLVADGKIP